MKSLLLLILPVVLGLNPENICMVNNRILGGERANETEFPGLVYIKSLVRKGSELLQGSCAGSLIGQHWVLTAAHCLVVNPPEQLLSVSVHPSKYDTTHIEPAGLIIHEKFGNHHNDIALIKLSAAMSTIEPNIKTMPLPAQDQPLTSNEVTLVGWGVKSTTKEQDFPPYLKKLEHVPIDQTICLLNGYSPYKALCRYPTIATGNTCPGDSGGPIIMDGLQVGIVSHSSNSRNFLFTTVRQIDTRVSGYRNWIDEKIRYYTS